MPHAALAFTFWKSSVHALSDEARDVENTADLVEGLGLQSRGLLYLARPAEALVLLKEGSRLASGRRALPAIWRLLSPKGVALGAIGDVEGAKQAFEESATIVRRVGDSIRDPQERASFVSSPPVASTLRESE